MPIIRTFYIATFVLHIFFLELSDLFSQKVLPANMSLKKLYFPLKSEIYPKLVPTFFQS